MRKRQRSLRDDRKHPARAVKYTSYVQTINVTRSWDQFLFIVINTAGDARRRSLLDWEQGR